MPTKKQQYPKYEEEKVVDAVAEETVDDTDKDRDDACTVCGVEHKPPKYRVIRCDAASLEKSLNSIKDIHSVWKILVEPSYNGALFNIIYLEFDDEE